MADKRRRVNSKGEITYQVRFIDKSKRSGFGYKSFKRAKDADLFKAKKDVEEGSPAPANVTSNLSIAQAVELWLSICEKVGRDGREPVEHMTLIEYNRRARVMLGYTWQKSIPELTTTDIVHFRSWLLENHSRDLARRTLSSFCSVLNEMCLQGHLASNPAIGITVKSGGRYETQNSEIVIPSDQEVRNIVAASETLKSKNKIFEKAWLRYRPMILLLVFAGLRMSELRGLNWDNIHPEHVDIRQRADQLGVIGPVKSRSAHRSIELSTKVTEEILAWREHCTQSKSSLVFPTASGRPIFLNNFYADAWRPLMREAGLVADNKSKASPKYTPHTLRHYYASKLIALGKDIKFIQNRMGHSSAEVTLDIYGHLMKGREAEHRETANQLASEFL